MGRRPCQGTNSKCTGVLAVLGGPYHRGERCPYASCAVTFPAWSWFPASTNQGSSRSPGAVNTCSKVSCQGNVGRHREDRGSGQQREIHGDTGWGRVGTVGAEHSPPSQAPHNPPEDIWVLLIEVLGSPLRFCPPSPPAPETGSPPYRFWDPPTAGPTPTPRDALLLPLTFQGAPTPETWSHTWKRGSHSSRTPS